MELHEEEGDGRERVDWQVFFSFWERERERERDLREFWGFFWGGGVWGRDIEFAFTFENDWENIAGLFIRYLLCSKNK